MKVLSGTALALALSITAVSSALARPATAQMNTVLLKSQTGQVESINNSTVIVRTTDGNVRMYQIEPAVITALKLTSGSTVLFNNSNLISGRITDINRNDIRVKLDNGTTQTYIATEVARRTLTTGDRVIVTPDMRIFRADRYTLTAKDVTLVQPVASSPTTDTTVRTTTQTTIVESTPQRTVVTSPVKTSTPIYSQPTTAVRALW
ncbi:hypothetical protein AVDCRST_MAG81-4592 [uncultured Synechococcales cyanobacterium]|uniref:Uncharacterized protein n=1 Tax=uncultured Synechococcales cyanobacterium TaxID=1936017 RepID=A0A6J4VVD2_9CYAN|nr:hypothetical protein AVDCRST_MAG81-4592 [uncultured Synechococcales cyanobacterium]